MPFFPEGLLTFKPKDLEGIQLEPLFRFFQPAGVAAAGLTDDLFFPLDRALILQHIHLVPIPGAAQFVNSQQLQLIQRANAITTIRAQLELDGTVFAVAQPASLSWRGSILIPNSIPTVFWGIRFSSGFNAGAAVNSHQLSYVGVAIPPGNLPLV